MPARVRVRVRDCVHLCVRALCTHTCARDLFFGVGGGVVDLFLLFSPLFFLPFSFLSFFRRLY